VELGASTSSGRASAAGMLQAILQAILQVTLQGAWPIGYSPKVLKGVVSIGCCACCLRGVLFLGPRS
jgi:hypothetical protein